MIVRGTFIFGVMPIKLAVVVFLSAAVKSSSFNLLAPSSAYRFDDLKALRHERDVLLPKCDCNAQAKREGVANQTIVLDPLRRNLLRGALVWASTTPYDRSASAYTIERVEPDEAKIYAEAQERRDGRPLRVLWVGAGDMQGVFRHAYFAAGNEVVALDLIKPDKDSLISAAAFANEHGFRLHFEQGDAQRLRFRDGSFDVVVSSMFLCQDFDPKLVVSEIRRVLRPGGRFGFYEHVEDIDEVIVSKVFGASSVVRVQHWPEMANIMAGVVKKI